MNSKESEASPPMSPKASGENDKLLQAFREDERKYEEFNKQFYADHEKRKAGMANQAEGTESR